MRQRFCIALGLLGVSLSAAVGCRHGAATEPVTRLVSRPAETVETIEERWPDPDAPKPRLVKQVIRSADGTLVNHGTYTRWYDNGQKEYEVSFDHGRKSGTATRWHRNGQVWMQEHYVDGERHGTSCTWDENGAKRQEEHHFHGKPHGTWTVWDSHGKIKWQGSFEHGVPQG